MKSFLGWRLFADSFKLLFFLHTFLLIFCLTNASNCENPKASSFVENEYNYFSTVEHMHLLYNVDWMSQESLLASCLEIGFDPPFLDFGQIPIYHPQYIEVTMTNLDADRTVELVATFGLSKAFWPKFNQTVLGSSYISGEHLIPSVAMDFINSSHKELRVQLLNPFLYDLKIDHVELEFLNGQRHSCQSTTIANQNSSNRSKVTASFDPEIKNKLHCSFQPQILTPFQDAYLFSLQIQTDLMVGLARFTLRGLDPTGTKHLISIKNCSNSVQGSQSGAATATATTTTSGFCTLFVPLNETDSPFRTKWNLLNFGILDTKAQPVSKPIEVINLSDEEITITNFDLYGFHPSISVQLTSVTIPARQLEPQNVAFLILSPNMAEQSLNISGTLSIFTSNPGISTTIPFYGRIIHGFLQTTLTQESFLNQDNESLIMFTYTLSNQYDFPVTILNPQLSDEISDLVVVHSMDQSSSQLLKPNQSGLLAKLSAHPALISSVESEFLVQTSIGSIKIPFEIFTGLLRLELEDAVELPADNFEMGVHLMGQSKIRFLLIHNGNPNPTECQSNREEVKEVLQALEELAINYDLKAQEIDVKNKELEEAQEALHKQSRLMQSKDGELTQLRDTHTNQKKKYTEMISNLLKDLTDVGECMSDQLTKPSFGGAERLDEEFTVMRLYISKMKTEAKSLQSRVRQLEEERVQHVQLMKKSDEECKDLQLKVHGLEVKVGSLTDKVDQSDSKKRQLQETVDNLNAEIAKLRANEQIISGDQSQQLLAGQSVIRAKLDEEFQRQSELYATQVKQLRDELDAKQKKLEEYTDELNQIKFQSGKSNEELARLREECETKTARLETLEKAAEKREQAKQDLRGLEETVIKELQTLHNLRRLFVQDLKNRMKKNANRQNTAPNSVPASAGTDANPNANSPSTTTTEILLMNDDDEDSGQIGSLAQREKIAFLENNLDKLTKVHKQLVHDNAELRIEVPKLEKRLKSTLERVRGLELSLKEAKEGAWRDRKRYLADVERIKEVVRQRNIAARRGQSQIAKPIRAGHAPNSPHAPTSTVSSRPDILGV